MSRRYFTSAGVLATTLLVGGPAAAQTIRPLVSEYQSQARGRLELVNESNQPLNVLIEPRSFTLSEDGEMRDEPLASTIRLKFSDMSFRLPPRQSRFVFYEATAEKVPAWFVIYANFTGYPARDFNGVNVQLELPHIVYLLPKGVWKAPEVRVNLVDLQRDTGKLVLTVENVGPQFGRLTSLEVQGVRRRVSLPGFPLFPGTRRRVELAWEADEEPRTVTVRSREFSFNQRLSVERP